MKRTIFISGLLGLVLMLLIAYQNASLFKAPGKELKIPGYFNDIYLETQKTPPLQMPEERLRQVIQRSPAYARIENELSGESPETECDPKNSKVICPPKGDPKLPSEPPLSFKMDPLRTLATVNMSESWKGTLRFNQEASPTVYLNKRVSDSGQLSFEIEQNQNRGKVSFDLQW